METLPQFQNDDQPFQMMQNRWASIINPVLKNPVCNGIILKNISLIRAQDNLVPHRLGRAYQGWMITRIQPANQNTDYGAFSDWALNSNITPDPTAFGVVTDKNLFFCRVGNSIFISGYWKSGTTAASTAKLTLPAGYTIDLNGVGTKASVQMVGQWNQIKSAAGAATVYPLGYSGPLFYDGSDTSSLYFATSTESNIYNKAPGSNVCDNNGYLDVNLQVPISGFHAFQNFNFAWESALPSSSSPDLFLNLHCINSLLIDLYVF